MHKEAPTGNTSRKENKMQVENNCFKNSIWRKTRLWQNA